MVLTELQLSTGFVRKDIIPIYFCFVMIIINNHDTLLCVLNIVYIYYAVIRMRRFLVYHLQSTVVVHEKQFGSIWVYILYMNFTTQLF